MDPTFAASTGAPGPQPVLKTMVTDDKQRLATANKIAGQKQP
jgi:hypothetical protein